MRTNREAKGSSAGSAAGTAIALIALLWAAALGAASTPAGAAAPGSAAGGAQYTQLMLAQGDSLEVRFPTPFCSGSVKKGAVLQGEIARNKVLSGCVALKEGTPVVVKVTDAKGNGFAGKAGKLSLLFESTVGADGAPIELNSPVQMKGKGRNIIVKVLTLFLIHGGEPCIGTQDRLFPKVGKDAQVLVDPAGCK